jgi:hypothetical protein
MFTSKPLGYAAKTAGQLLEPFEYALPFLEKNNEFIHHPATSPS